ncbi:5-oxoprolinase subunit B family protein [Rhodococcus sp. IEGM 1408]|uniref:5-oxoprolinase subunit B family protein n=1 Tax=Rhodococcus sp. IEGM 1408 TaxID=3082220 RepID=UPI002952D6FA|nr:carboxyltransferase domain-containing protein [Rhodococcus sp. IEGM 1408]MDV8001663.1 carboxyltransferase domain-containing protein [Rhodococcus sp. IEGM 1408]
MTTTRILRCGEAALLLECADLAGAVALARRVEQLRPAALDVVAAARTVLVTTRDSAALPELRRRLEALLAERPPRPGDPGDAAAGAGAGSEAAGREVTIDVRYDGPDLADVAELAGLSPQALVRQHTSITWLAAFGGFAPGFFYLVDERELRGAGSDDPATYSGAGAEGTAAGDSPAEPPSPVPPSPGPLPTVPRLASPRERVPAGSVGLADRFCAVYPGASPGGWRLLGTTDSVLWDSGRSAPALLAPGMRVRFRDAAS